LGDIVKEFWSNVRPGGRLHPAWFFEAKRHLAVELLLFAVILYLLTRKSFKPRKEKPLTKKEQEELVDEWVPEPLVPSAYANNNTKGSGRGKEINGEAAGQNRNKKNKQMVQYNYAQPPVVRGKASSPMVQIGNKKVLNLVSTNFLNLADREQVEETCEAALEKYGCGSCGPRGFYGTIDVHIELERRFAQFLGTEMSILYSYDISVPASAIPAFCKSGDVIVADAGVNYAIQSGLALSRSNVKYFEHNNLQDLVKVLDSVVAENKKNGTAASMQRRFIVVEGLYTNYGDISPLKEIIDLKEQYEYRLIVDESYALGSLGKTGRGSTEHHGVEVESVDILMASLGNAVGSVGGICAGSRRVCDHQRLSGAGYVFSASLPPYLASCAIETLNILEEEGPELVETLSGKVKVFRTALAEAVEAIPALKVHQEKEEDFLSPIIHLQYTDEEKTVAEQIETLEKLCKLAQKDGVFLSVAKYSFLDRFAAFPFQSIKMAINVEHEEEDLLRATQVIKKLASKLLL
jgi:serine palmitoyltransferase